MRLTTRLLAAMRASLIHSTVMLEPENEFPGTDPNDFDRALAWIDAEITAREIAWISRRIGASQGT